MSHNSLPFRLQNPADKSRINDLLENTPHIQVYDELRGQLEELIKSNHPKIKFTPTALEEAVNKHLGTTPIEEYGVWMYYPWSNRLVHILDEEEFAEVRTNRNRPKITREERAVLSQQIIGIIGLSVGQSIAITLAMERSFGEIRLADFDELELSNLNRIRSGVHQLGIKKVINVAREIAEIDPYLKVTCFPEGLTEANMDAFFTDGGKLNVLIDECDGLDIKIHARHKAKALGIPVLMEMNDRCTFDVERFDLEPNRPILHGLIDHLDTSQLQGLTNEQKIPYIMPMLGEHTISTKLKASMLEIEQSINTWPQLASAVVMGGAVVASTYRRMVLGVLLKRRSVFLKRKSPFLKRRSPLLKRGSPFLKRRSPLLKRGSAFLKRGSPFLKRGSPLLKRKSPFLKRGSPLLKRKSAFLKRGSALLRCKCALQIFDSRQNYTANASQLLLSIAVCWYEAE